MKGDQQNGRKSNNIAAHLLVYDDAQFLMKPE
jgi:hypothetical protein